MHRLPILAAASLATIVTLTACSPAQPGDTGKTPDTAPVATTPAPDPSEAMAESEFGASATSSRGNLVKEIGQLAGTSTLDSDVVTSRFAVTDIVVDPECTSGFADTPENGHYLGVHLNVETTPELADDDFPWISFTQYDWQAYDADGKRLNDPVATPGPASTLVRCCRRRSGLGRACRAGSCWTSLRPRASWSSLWEAAPPAGSGPTETALPPGKNEMPAVHGGRPA